MCEVHASQPARGFASTRLDSTPALLGKTRWLQRTTVIRTNVRPSVRPVSLGAEARLPHVRRDRTKVRDLVACGGAASTVYPCQRLCSV